MPERAKVFPPETHTRMNVADGAKSPIASRIVTQLTTTTGPDAA